MFRFIHSSDLHLGKRYGNIPEDLRGRLREARHAVIETLAARAHDHDAGTILLAGDTFDTETPTPGILRQALSEMASRPNLKWVILPGNHDSLQASQLWESMNANLPANVILATKPEPIFLTDGIAILPAPCAVRRPGKDVTEWMDGCETPEGAMRIGLAHGPVQDFSEEGNASGVLAVDRAARAGLDYLALGDWHGALSLNERTHYSGTPEPDRFKHDKPGQAFVVSISERGATPTLLPVETGRFAWSTPDLHLLAGEDVEVRLAQTLPPSSTRRQCLMQLAVSGHVGIELRLALEVAIEHAAPEFALLQLNVEELTTEIEITDLDEIDHAGALRVAAEALLEKSNDAALSVEARDVAQAALRRLFSMAQQVAK